MNEHIFCHLQLPNGMEKVLNILVTEQTCVLSARFLLPHESHRKLFSWLKLNYCVNLLLMIPNEMSFRMKKHQLICSLELKSIFKPGKLRSEKINIWSEAIKSDLQL